MESKNDPESKRPAEEVLRAHTPRPAVRRLNRTAITVIFLVVAIIFAGRMIVGLFHRYAAQIADEERERNRLRAPDDFAERGVLGKLPADYTFTIPPPTAPPVPQPEKVVEEPPRVVIDPDILKQLEALRREQEMAINSPIQFPGAQPRSPVMSDQGWSSPPDQRSPNDWHSITTPDKREPRYDAQRRDFFRDATNVQTYVRSPLLPPRSLFEIKAGTIISAALITPINTDLPGDVVGQVTTNLFDSITGQYLLVPQGSRLIGRYDSEVHKGQNRALIAWQRLILPNGYSIVLETMPGTDAQGVAGLADRVDWHASRLAGATLLSTLISLGGNYAANINPERQELSIVGETVAQDAARVGQRVIDRELDLRPTIIVREGTPFAVLVNKDLELVPYQPVITGR